MSLTSQMQLDAGDTTSPAVSSAPANPYAAEDAAAETKYGLPSGILSAISSVESNHNPKAINKNTNGTIDQGRFQVNSSNPDINGNDPEQVAQFISNLHQQSGGDLNKTVAMYHMGAHGKLDSPEANRYVSKFQEVHTPAPELGGAVPPVSNMQAASPRPTSGLAAQMAGDAGAFAQEAPSGIPGAPENTTTQNVLAGIGHGMATTAANIKQGFDTAASSLSKAAEGTAIGNAINWLGNKLGMPSAEQAAQGTNAYIAEQHKYGDPLLKTTAGNVGNFIGQTAALAPTALIPGAGTLAGAGAIGAGAGLATTEGNLQQRLTGAAGGAIGGVAGSALGSAIGAGASKLGEMASSSTALQNAATSGRNAMVDVAQKYGLKLNPQTMNPNAVNSMLGGISGKVQTAQAAASANQPVINNIVKNELGIAPNAPLNADTLSAIRQQAGNAYNTVRNAGTVTPGESYTNALNTILSNTTGQAKSFPGLKNEDISGVINTLNQKAFDAGDAIDATRFLRNLADKSYAAGDKQTGAAYKQASGALEDALESHLQNSGNPAALANFKNARQTIAQTYTVQKAMNPATGDIDASKLAAQLNKGQPLSGGLKDVAQLSNAFPKETQLLKTPYQGISPLDIAMGIGSGALGTIGTGSPLGALGVATTVGRPMLRSALLSGPSQKINASLGGSNYLNNFASKVLAPTGQSQTLADLVRLAATNQGKN